MRLRSGVIAGAIITSGLAIGARAVPVQADRGRSSSTFECATAPTEAANVTLDCPDEYALPTGEPAIAVDPADPDHTVTASLNERWPDQTIQVATTFDGGEIWTIGDLPRPVNTVNWDPWLSFDAKRGTVLLAFEQDSTLPGICFQNQLVTTSVDGGHTWSSPVMVVPGPGCPGEVGQLFEEGKIATDNSPSSPYYGRSWVTANYQVCKQPGSRCFSAIGETHSDDGGTTWTAPQVISGSNAEYCTSGPGHPPHCDDSAPPALAVVGSDGTVHVAFINAQHGAAQEPFEQAHQFFHDPQILVVSSSDGGDTWSPPVHVVDLEGGGGDFECTPAYYFGCRLSGTAVAAYLVGNPLLAAAPDGALYIAFSDNRNGRHDVPKAHSNEDVFLMTSTDGGATWTGPDPVAGAQGDEFNPNIAVDPATGELGIAYYDRSDTPSKTMNVSLARGLPGSFSISRITTESSHLSEDLWWAQSLPGCHRCLYHIGEYLGIAFGSDGAANLVWADLRRFTETPQGETGFSMNVDYARSGGDVRTRRARP